MPHTCFWSYLHSWIDIFKFSRPLYNCPALHLSWQCIAVILTSYDARICFWSNLHSWINIFKFSRGLYNCPALHSFWYCVAVMLASLYVSPLWSEWVNEEFICTMGALCIGNTCNENILLHCDDERDHISTALGQIYDRKLSRTLCDLHSHHNHHICSVWWIHHNHYNCSLSSFDLITSINSL